MTTEDISRKVSKELDIKFDIVDRIHKLQYKFMMETMKEGVSDIKLIYIGKFVKKNNAKPRKA
jgi:hypothetical protein